MTESSRCIRSHTRRYPLRSLWKKHVYFPFGTALTFKSAAPFIKRVALLDSSESTRPTAGYWSDHLAWKRLVQPSCSTKTFSHSPASRSSYLKALYAVGSSWIEVRA